MKAIKYIFAVLFILLAIVAGAYFFSKSKLEKPLGKEIIITIEPSTNIKQAAEKLAENAGKSKKLYSLAARAYAYFEGGHIYAGTFKFPADISSIEAIRGLFSKEYFYFISITFPEGFSNERYAKIAADSLDFTKESFLANCTNSSILIEYGIEARSCLGYLLPDTYSFDPNVNAEKVVRSMLSLGTKFWNEKNTLKAAELGYTKHEILTLASIIEAETPVSEEKAIVSGLYHNRLRIGMMLQSDPTVQFALGEKRRVLYEDLKVQHPYNTYFIGGLPPGPINNPGREAIIAALNPAEHDYLYMVAVGDGSGRHNFAKNLTQHANFVRQFRKNIGR